MKVPLLDLTNKKIGEISLPKQFSEDIRPELIARAVLALESKARQPYGADPEAGKRASANISRRRHNYRGAYGYGISRVPRKILSRRGTRMNWVGAVSPGTVGGREAHPPKASKIFEKKINKNENRKAIRSALASTSSVDIVKSRGHSVPENYPFVIDDKIESIKKTKDVIKSLVNIGLKEELARSGKRKVRNGKGKMRGRKYKRKTGPLLVVSKKCELIKGGANIQGLNVAEVSSLNAKLLAPGAMPGRITIFTKGAIERMEKEALFM